MLSTSELTRPERLLVFRRRNDLTQVQAAEQYGVTPWTYRRWEDGTNMDGAPMPALHTLLPGEACFILRRRAGLSRREFATRVGITPWWLTQMERGRVPANLLMEYWSRCTPQ